MKTAVVNILTFGLGGLFLGYFFKFLIILPAKKMEFNNTKPI